MFSNKKTYNSNDAIKVIETLNLDLSSEYFGIEDLIAGLNVESEHGTVSPKTNVTNDDLIDTAKIALAHLNEYPDYYHRLRKLEDDAEKFWKTKKRYVLKKVL